jgi:hypothetical protein
MTLNLLYLTMTLNLKRKMSHFINEFKQNRNSVDINKGIPQQFTWFVDSTEVQSDCILMRVHTIMI